jgi:hypothetical protein
LPILNRSAHPALDHIAPTMLFVYWGRSQMREHWKHASGREQVNPMYQMCPWQCGQLVKWIDVFGINGIDC